VPTIRQAIAAALLPLTAAAAAQETTSQAFNACLSGLQERARQAGVADWIVEEVIPGMEFQARVIELDRRQPEFVKTFGEYLSARVTPARVERGRALYAEHREFLDRLASRYGIPGRYLVAFWGLETNFGGYLGTMPTLDSLATLACDHRRRDFFSTQFITALEMVQREQLAPGQLRGSWAGAIGHTQFMPTTYARYAVDGDGDGRIDLSGSHRDALASGANYLSQLGWQPGARWGREVTLPDDFDFSKSGLEQQLTLARWATMGVRTADAEPLPGAELTGSILVPAGAGGPAFLVYENFRVIMGWNRSEYYALSVGYLADRIGGAGQLRRPPPADQQALSRQEVIALQIRLAERGYTVGPADGIFGPGTRRALSEFQQDAGLTADGFPDAATLRRLAAR
jgi:membrane-bound lytic murein transglycosylase B